MSFHLPGVQLQRISEIDNAILPMLAAIESTGMPVDVEHMHRLGHQFQTEIDKARFICQQHAWPDFNPGSADQVSHLLFDVLRLQRGKKTKGKTRYTTDDKTLERLKHEHPVVPMIQRYREFDKLKGTFVDGILDNVTPELRLHTRLNHARVVSGRLSSSEPNLQNIPSEGSLGKSIRMGFKAPFGRKLVVADLAQIELRILTEYTHDPVMVEAYLNNEDLHSKTAAGVGGYSIADFAADPLPKELKALRYASKRFNFGMAYGISDEGLKDQLHLQGIMWSVADVAHFRHEWFKLYSQVRPAMEFTWAYGREHGYVVDIWGRPRMLQGLWSDSPKIRSEAERQGFNHICQGGAAGVIKLIMARMWRELPDTPLTPCTIYDILWLLQVHDEIILEIPDDDKIAKRVVAWVDDVMRTTVKFSIPVFGSVSVCDAWGEK